MKMPLVNRRRVGVFGGTFDPIHVGHLILAEEAWFQLQLDCVYLVPAGDPPHKQDRPITPVHHRLCMAELATADIDYFTISRVDADRPGPHYAADMLRQLQGQLGAETELYFLMGMDSLRDLPTWREPMWLVKNCKLVALSRHDIQPDWTHLSVALPGIREHVIVLDMPELEIASSSLRERLCAGQTIRHQVPRAVEAYIHKHGLYR
jgi:nicotinate-nucleotide adenylyltransferase